MLCVIVGHGGVRAGVGWWRPKAQVISANVITQLTAEAEKFCLAFVHGNVAATSIFERTTMGAGAGERERE